jgi:hypothetical protein
MAILVKCRIHPAVYWKSKGPDGRGGNVYESPVAMMCRWDEDEESIVRVGYSEHICTDSVICDRHVSTGDRMWLGTLASIPTSLHHKPEDIRNSRTVRRVQILTKLRNADRTDFSKTLVVALLS